MFGLGLGLGIHRHSSANPYAFPFISRVESDGGAIRDKAALLNLTYYLQSMMPNTKLLYCPELGVKLRTSGVNNYITTLYDISSNMSDATQTTALNQPFLSGNIAPNERFLIKAADNSDSYLNHDVISFSSSDKWSITTVIKSTGSKDWQFYLGGFAGKCRIGLAHPSLGYNFRYYNDVSETIGPTRTNYDLVGKSVVFTCVANGNNSLRIFLNGVLLGTYSINTASTIKCLLKDAPSYSSYQFKGTIAYHAIRNIELDATQVQQEYTYLRSIFPEIESVQIGTQTWTTSNCEMTCTPQGNVIQEMQAATNVEKITNAADREFSSDTGFWTKTSGATILDGVARFTNVTPYNGGLRKTLLTVGKAYLFTYTVKNWVSGNVALFDSNYGITIATTGNGTYSRYLVATGSTVAITSTDDINQFDLESVSIQEVGWSDSTNLYNGIYAKATGTAEQKEYAAVKAAAMWCYYSNDPALGAVYGKLYNWYAVKLLQMDIDYYNAANPTTPWGWRVPTNSDFTALSTYLGGDAVAGGKLKKDGTSYWYAPNSGADNSSGFSMLGAGRRGSVSGGFVDYKVLAILGTSDKLPSGDWGFFAQYDTMSINPSGYAVPTSDQNGFSLRLIKS